MPGDPYVYPGTQTLRNLYGIRDRDRLAQVEARVTTARIFQLEESPEPGRYDLTHLQAIHRRIFQDVYGWAGQLRTVDIAKGDMFAHHPHIASYLGDVLAGLSRENYLLGLGREQLIDRLTFYLAEINAVHPFREGNGRAQRAFVSQLAGEAGYFVDWRDLDPGENIAASRAAMNGNNEPLRALIDSRTDPADSTAAAGELHALRDLGLARELAGLASLDLDGELDDVDPEVAPDDRLGLQWDHDELGQDPSR